MDAGRIKHSRRLAVVIVLIVLVLGLYVSGIDGVSLKIAWYRLRLLSESPEVGCTQVQRLAALGDRGTRHLMWWGVLHDIDAVQVAAIRVFDDRHSLEAVPALIRALDDNSWVVRDAANSALEHISGESMDFNPYAAWANRRNEVRLWEEWWAARQQDITATPTVEPDEAAGAREDVASDAATP